MDQIDLYRETRESIMQGLDGDSWNSMPYAARDRAMLAELKAENNLHPALYQPDDSADVLGHYKVSASFSHMLVKKIMMYRQDNIVTQCCVSCSLASEKLLAYCRQAFCLGHCIIEVVESSVYSRGGCRSYKPSVRVSWPS